MRALLDRARACGLKLNWNKLKLHAESLSYMGHTLSARGLQADTGKIAAIEKMPPPGDVKAVQRLLGMSTFLSRYVPTFSEITAPIRALLNSKNEFLWTQIHDEAFKKLKSLLTSNTVLQFYDANKPVTLQCDSSQFALGAVMLQANKPVAYASRALSKSEESWAQIEKELLAILFALQRFHTYVYARRVTIVSDHKPLLSIVSKCLTSAPRRLQRMLLKLQRYDFELVYAPGAKIVVADTLSRAFPPNSTADESELFRDEIAAIDTEPELVVVASDYVVQLIRDAAEKDELYISLRSQIKAGWPSAQKSVPKELLTFYSLAGELAVENGLIFRGPRLFVPTAARRAMLERAHSSHLGINSSVRRMSEAIWWPKMTAELTEYINRCTICNQFPASTPPREPLKQHTVPRRAWEKIGVDLFQSHQQDYLITVDYATNFFEIDRLETKRGSEIIYKLKQHFARHGLPLVCCTDNGPPYGSSEFRDFMAKYEIEHVTSSPRFSRSNGKVEASVKIAKRLMKRAIADGKDPYLFLLDWRNCPTEGLGLSPAQMLMGRRTRTLLSVSPKLLESAVSSEEIQSKLAAAKAKQAYYYNRTAKCRENSHSQFQTGQTVRVKLNDKPEWKKATIVEKLPHRSYIVKTDAGTEFRRNSKHVRFSAEPPIIVNEFEDEQQHRRCSRSSSNSKQPLPSQQQQQQEQQQQQQQQPLSSQQQLPPPTQLQQQLHTTSKETSEASAYISG